MSPMLDTVAFPKHLLSQRSSLPSGKKLPLCESWRLEDAKGWARELPCQFPELSTCQFPEFCAFLQCSRQLNTPELSGNTLMAFG